MLPKLLADENIHLEAVQQLKRDGLDIVSQSILNPGASDKQLLSYAWKEQRVLITFDKDFGKLIFRT